MIGEPRALTRGTVIGGWEVQRPLGERPWPEAKAERADGTQARLLVIPWSAAPAPEVIAAWRAALAPAWLDQPAFPALRGVGHDPAAGAVWIARAWTPWTTFASVIGGATPLAPGRRGAALVALGEALAVLHGGGAVHGALAPARVLLARADGSACEVLDLGVAAVAASLGLRVPGVARAPADVASAVADVQAYATIVDAVMAGPGDDRWRGHLASWCASVASAPPRIDEALAALRAILPEPEPAEPPPPPIPPPSARDLEIIERVQRERDEEIERRNEALRRTLEPPPERVDRDTPFVPPIVVGGPAIEADAWPALIRAWRPDARLTVLAPGTIVTDPVTWRLGGGQRADAAEAIARAIADAIDALGGTSDRGRGGRSLADELQQHGFARVDAWPDHLRPRTIEPRERPWRATWWHRPGTRVVIEGRVTTVQRERQAWVTSHQLGTVADDVVELVGDGPRDGRHRLVTAILAVVARIDERPTITYVCRFCRHSFGGLHFHSSLGACHRCAERYLHIVH